MKIYLSGPITYDVDFLTHFREHSTKLKAMGHKVLDPTVWSRENLHLTYEEYMALDIPMLRICNAIYMLPGWSDSRGAKRELDEAVRLGLKVYYAEDNNVPPVPKIYRRK